MDVTVIIVIFIVFVNLFAFFVCCPLETIKFPFQMCVYLGIDCLNATFLQKGTQFQTQPLVIDIQIIWRGKSLDGSNLLKLLLCCVPTSLQQKIVSSNDDPFVSLIKLMTHHHQPFNTI